MSIKTILNLNPDLNDSYHRKHVTYLKSIYHKKATYFPPAEEDSSLMSCLDVLPKWDCDRMQQRQTYELDPTVANEVTLPLLKTALKLPKHFFDKIEEINTNSAKEKDKDSNSKDKDFVKDIYDQFNSTNKEKDKNKEVYKENYYKEKDKNKDFDSSKETELIKDIKDKEFNKDFTESASKDHAETKDKNNILLNNKDNEQLKQKSSNYRDDLLINKEMSKNKSVMKSRFVQKIKNIKLHVMVFDQTSLLPEEIKLVSYMIYVEIAHHRDFHSSKITTVCIPLSNVSVAKNKAQSKDVALYHMRNKHAKIELLPNQTLSATKICADTFTLGIFLTLKKSEKSVITQIREEISDEKNKSQPIHQSNPNAPSSSYNPQSNDEFEKDPTKLKSEDSVHYNSESHHVHIEGKKYHESGVIQVEQEMARMLKESTMVGLEGINYEFDKKFAQFILNYQKYQGNYCCRIDDNSNLVNPKDLLDQMELEKRDNSVVYNFLINLSYSSFELTERKAIHCVLLGLLQYKSFFNNRVNLKAIKGPLYFNSKFDFKFKTNPRKYVNEVNVEFDKLRGLNIIETVETKLVVIPYFVLPDAYREYGIEKESSIQKTRVNIVGLINVKSVYVLERSKYVKLDLSERKNDLWINNRVEISYDSMRDYVEVVVVDYVFKKYENTVDIRDLVSVVVEIDKMMCDAEHNDYMNLLIKSLNQSRKNTNVCDF